jgi:imidazolonepropionase-like amidohydrolase
MHLSRAALRAAITEAHRRHMKVTGHLCAVTYAEAAAMGIDDLEHGFYAATDFAPAKKPDECPPDADERSAVLMSDPTGPQARALIDTLVKHHVAITSTLPVFEDLLPGRKPDPRGIALLSPALHEDYVARRAHVDAHPAADGERQWRNDLALERAFVAAGGLLLAGPDPTGMGGVIPGFGDQREIELLVEAGFSAVEAIHIATYNGAAYLGRQDRIGTIAPGKRADLVIVRGDPGARVRDVENVEVVFKGGVGYDPRALTEPLRGSVGRY